jgi:hypothetical protein
MITKKEIVELLNEYGGYVDRSRTEKAIHEDNFELIADAILSKLHQPTVTVCLHPFNEVVSGDDGDFCCKCQTYLKSNRL